jgi:hypothetical protein
MNTKYISHRKSRGDTLIEVKLFSMSVRESTGLFGGYRMMEERGKMMQPECEPIMQTIQMLAREIDVVDKQMEALDSEGMDQLNPLHYLRSQSRLYPLIKAKNALITEWDNAMNEFAICRSKPRTSY